MSNMIEFEQIFEHCLDLYKGYDGGYENSNAYWAYKGWNARQNEIDSLLSQLRNIELYIECLEMESKYKKFKLTKKQKRDFDLECYGVFVNAGHCFAHKFIPKTKLLLEYWIENFQLFNVDIELLSENSKMIIEEYKKTKSDKEKFNAR